MAGPALRVLRVIARLNIGGPARHVTLLNRGLEAAGHRTLLVYGPPGEREGSLEDLAAGLPVVRLRQLGRRVRFGSDLIALAQITWHLFRFRPDVVHTHTAKAGTLGRLATAVYNLTRPRSARALVVHTFHGHVLSGYFGPVGDRLVRWTERALARLTDIIVAISEEQRRDLIERFAVCKPAQTTVIRLGLELDAFTSESGPSLKGALDIPEHALVIGYVGRFVPIKNLPLLLDAFARVHRAVPQSVLVLAGDGPLREPIQADVRTRGLDAHVRCAGWPRDLAALYRTCDIVALTSDNEGTPVALIEAMAAGRAVVATRVGGVPDVVRHGVTGLLTSAGASDELLTAIVSLARDPSLRRSLGQSARADVVDRYSGTRLVRDITQLYVSTQRRLVVDRTRAAPVETDSRDPDRRTSDPL